MDNEQEIEILKLRVKILEEEMKKYRTQHSEMYGSRSNVAAIPAIPEPQGLKTNG